MSDKITRASIPAASGIRQPPRSSSVIPKEQMTPYQRWEIPNFDHAQTSRSVAGTSRIADELGELQKKSRDDGYAAGHSEGYAAGLQQARTEAAQIHTLMQNLQEGINHIDQELAQSLLDLSLEVARKMATESLKVKPEIILEVIRTAIASLPHFNQNAHLILHPQDAELVREQMGEQLIHAGWKIFTDSKIQCGGCKLETAHSNIDATVQERWNHIVESIGQDQSWLA